MKPYAVKATLKTTLKSKRERWGIIDFADGRKPGLEKSTVKATNSCGHAGKGMRAEI